MSMLQRLRERFWFLPAVMCVGAFVLAESLIALDRVLANRWPDWGGTLLYRVGESGSRDLLGAIGTSALAVAGTTFSITMAVLALTSSSYGPRLVRNFMADRGNQAVLGVFVSTFLYALLVLRSVRALGDPADGGDVFVPHLAVNVAVVLAVLNVAVLVYFIHHISDSIQISTLAGGVRVELRRVVDRMYPAELGHDERETDEPVTGLPEDLDDGAPVTAGGSGYIQSIRDDSLLAAAREHDILVALRVRPGRYVLDDTIVARVHPATSGSDEVMDAVRRAIQIAGYRSPHQDVEFAVQQLTEMAVRAMSSGVNDPYTAVNALDDLSAGLSVLAGRPRPSAARFDDDGELRVHAPAVDLVEVVGPVVDAMRWNAGSSPPVMHATLNLVARVGRQDVPVELTEHLRAQVTLLSDAFAAAGHSEHDIAKIAVHADEVLESLVSQRG